MIFMEILVFLYDRRIVIGKNSSEADVRLSICYEYSLFCS